MISFEKVLNLNLKQLKDIHIFIIEDKQQAIKKGRPENQDSP
jgi:hypothetical protein